MVYGSAGTQNARAFAEAVTALEGGHRTIVTASGLSAVAHTLSALTRAGDHILVGETAYAPTRAFCESTLAKFGVETTFFDATKPEQIDALARRSTRLVFLETPGSWFFDMHDVPELTRRARARSALVALDNTWATPLYCQPLQLGVDVVIHAGTKAMSGHSDVVIGSITAKSAEHFRTLADHVAGFGDVASPEDCALALRGLRTLSVRLERQSRSALALARWLAARPEVRQVFYPALEGDPGHALWRRDFTGAGSVFSVRLAAASARAAAALVDGLQLFRIGSSYGGYASLVSVNAAAGRTGAETSGLIRLHIGLEDPQDLIEDLEAGFARLAASQPQFAKGEE